MATLNKTFEDIANAIIEKDGIKEKMTPEQMSDRILNISTQPPEEPTLIFGIEIDENNSDPYTRVTYTDNAVGYTPMSVNGTTGAVNYGSWKNFIDEFINPEPCMLKNGTLQYLLNPNDNAKKIDNTNADITSGNDGDVMVKFKKRYYKWEEIGTKRYFKVSNKKIDDTYVRNAFLSEDGNATEEDYMYFSAYEGYSLSGKLRSLSGKTPTTNQDITTFRTQATANGLGYQQETLKKRMYIGGLLCLLGKSTNCQAVFGNGVCSGAIKNTGTLNDKGLFYGLTSNTTTSVKVLGIENFWGNFWTFCDGIHLNNGVYYYKKSSPYNDTSNNYTNTQIVIPSGLGVYIIGMSVFESNILLPNSISGGSGSTYYCDTIDSKNTGITICMVGGDSSANNGCGMFAFSLYNTVTAVYTVTGGRLTYS